MGLVCQCVFCGVESYLVDYGLDFILLQQQQQLDSNYVSLPSSISQRVFILPKLQDAKQHGGASHTDEHEPVSELPHDIHQ